MPLTDYTIAVLEDTIRILGLFRNEHGGLSLAEIADSSGLVKNKAFRILFTLEKHHMVERDENGKFRLGLRFLEFGRHVQSQTRLLQSSHSVMDWLVQETRESIFLGVISGEEALCVAVRESPRSIRLFAEVGRRTALHSGGVPKVLLAHLSGSERGVLLDKYHESASDASGHMINRQALEEVLDHIRETGYAVVIDDLDIGALSIAAPIRSHQGRVIAAISIAGPSHRFTDERIQHYTQVIVKAAGQISMTLGYASPEILTNGLHNPALF